MYKKIIGIIAVLIGCALLYFGYDISRQMDEARGKITESGSGDMNIIPKNPITHQIEKSIKSDYYQKVESYQIYVTLCYAGGPIFIVVGGVIFFLGFRKKKR